MKSMKKKRKTEVLDLLPPQRNQKMTRSPTKSQVHAKPWKPKWQRSDDNQRQLWFWLRPRTQKKNTCCLPLRLLP